MSSHACKLDAQLPQVEKEFHFDSNNFGFICLAQAAWAFIKEMPDIISVVCLKLTAFRAPIKTCLLADGFLRPMA